MTVVWALQGVTEPLEKELIGRCLLIKPLRCFGLKMKKI